MGGLGVREGRREDEEMGMGNREKKKEVCGCGSGREEVEEGGGMRDGGKKLVRTSDGGEGRPVDRRHRTQAMGEEGVGEAGAGVPRSRQTSIEPSSEGVGRELSAQAGLEPSSQA